MSSNYERRLYEWLQPEQVVANFLRMGVALTLYELIKSQVLHQVREFYCFGFNEDGWLYDEEAFKRQVLDLAPGDRFGASLLWLERSDAINSDDMKILDRLYDYRKTLAHESGWLLLDPDFEIDDDLVKSARDILEKISLFWARIDSDVSEAFAGSGISDEDIGLPLVMFFDHVHSIERAWQKELEREVGAERSPNGAMDG